VETPIRDPNGGIISNRDLICSIVSGPGCGGSASPLLVELEPPPLPGGERGEGAEKERRSRAQAGAIGALSLTSTPPPPHPPPRTASPVVQEEKEWRSRGRVEESSSSWSHRRSTFDADGRSSAVGDEEGGSCTIFAGDAHLLYF
jgi:hypothetical protein